MTPRLERARWEAPMVYVQHELREEFPKAVERIDELSRMGCGFTKMAAEYEFLNREIYLIESRMNLATVEELETLRKQRQEVRDRIVACLNSQGKC
jgi:uncharacterized protein YdcH (DUF465 family)